VSNFDETVIRRLTALEREVERLRVWERPAGGSGVTDHGALTGLADDDHPQYLLTTGKAADSDKLDGIDSTGFATATHSHDHGALTGLGDNDHPQYVLVNNAKMQIMAALNDDTATSITPSNNQGFLLYRMLSGATGAVISFDAVTGTAYCFKIAGSADIETMTGALTGTTGTDGKITISAHTDGKIYIENRLGTTLYGGYVAL